MAPHKPTREWPLVDPLPEYRQGSLHHLQWYSLSAVGVDEVWGVAKKFGQDGALITGMAARGFRPEQYWSLVPNPDCTHGLLELWSEKNRGLRLVPSRAGGEE